MTQPIGIQSVQLSNTFDYWRQRANEAIRNLNKSDTGLDANGAFANAGDTLVHRDDDGNFGANSIMMRFLTINGTLTVFDPNDQTNFLLVDPSDEANGSVQIEGERASLRVPTVNNSLTVNDNLGADVRGRVRFHPTRGFEGFGQGDVWSSLGGVINHTQDTFITADNDDFIRIYTNADPQRPFHDPAAAPTTSTDPNGGRNEWRWAWNNAGHLVVNTDDTYNIGENDRRVKTGYFRNLTVGNLTQDGNGVSIISETKVLRDREIVLGAFGDGWEASVVSSTGTDFVAELNLTAENRETSAPAVGDFLFISSSDNGGPEQAVFEVSAVSGNTITLANGIDINNNPITGLVLTTGATFLAFGPQADIHVDEAGIIVPGGGRIHHMLWDNDENVWKFSDTIEVDSTEALRVPVGTTSERPTDNPTADRVQAKEGHIRFNTDTTSFEGFIGGGVWAGIGGVTDSADGGDTFLNVYGANTPSAVEPSLDDDSDYDMFRFWVGDTTRTTSTSVVPGALAPAAFGNIQHNDPSTTSIGVLQADLTGSYQVSADRTAVGQYVANTNFDFTLQVRDAAPGTGILGTLTPANIGDIIAITRNGQSTAVFEVSAVAVVDDQPNANFNGRTIFGLNLPGATSPEDIFTNFGGFDAAQGTMAGTATVSTTTVSTANSTHPIAEAMRIDRRNADSGYTLNSAHPTTEVYGHLRVPVLGETTHGTTVGGDTGNGVPGMVRFDPTRGFEGYLSANVWAGLGGAVDSANDRDTFINVYGGDGPSDVTPAADGQFNQMRFFIGDGSDSSEGLRMDRRSDGFGGAGTFTVNPAFPTTEVRGHLRVPVVGQAGTTTDTGLSAEGEAGSIRFVPTGVNAGFQGKLTTGTWASLGAGTTNYSGDVTTSNSVFENDSFTVTTWNSNNDTLANNDFTISTINQINDAVFTDTNNISIGNVSSITSNNIQLDGSTQLIESINVDSIFVQNSSTIDSITTIYGDVISQTPGGVTALPTADLIGDHVEVLTLHAATGAGRIWIGGATEPTGATGTDGADRLVDISRTRADFTIGSINLLDSAGTLSVDGATVNINPSTTVNIATSSESQTVTIGNGTNATIRINPGNTSAADRFLKCTDANGSSTWVSFGVYDVSGTRLGP